MSQRLLVCYKKNINMDEDSIYDGIYTEESDMNTLLYDWCCYDKNTGNYLGPFKVTIRDHAFLEKFNEDFEKLSKYIPELQDLSDCWKIYLERTNEVYTNEKEEKKCNEAVKVLEKQAFKGKGKSFMNFIATIFVIATSLIVLLSFKITKEQPEQKLQKPTEEVDYDTDTSEAQKERGWYTPKNHYPSKK